MIKRRSILTILPAAVLAACARVQAEQSAPQAQAQSQPRSALMALISATDQTAWLVLTGTVRLRAGNSDVRSATLHRAVRAGRDGGTVRYFDVWKSEGAQGIIGSAISGPSLTRTDMRSQDGPNDAGIDGFWLNRTFTHQALLNPVECSRLARSNARVMAIDATQIWLVEGGVGSAPELSMEARAQFNAWQNA